MFNEYAFGGYLIFKGVKAYIDGRADMYGDAFVQQYLAIAGGAAARRRQGFQALEHPWAILSPRDGAGAACWTPSPAGGGSTPTASRCCSPRRRAVADAGRAAHA